MSQLDPTARRTLQFLFPRCQARLEGPDLVVTVQSPGVTFRGAVAMGATVEWTSAADVPLQVGVDCEPGQRRRFDGHEYPLSPAYAEGATFRFHGGLSYGRVLRDDGWALCVQATLRSLTGIAGPWETWDAILVETTATAPAASTLLSAAGTTATADATGGPHLPYP